MRWLWDRNLGLFCLLSRWPAQGSSFFDPCMNYWWKSTLVTQSPLNSSSRESNCPQRNLCEGHFIFKLWHKVMKRRPEIRKISTICMKSTTAWRKKNSTQTLFQLIYVNLLILLSENDWVKLYPINTVTIFMYARDKLNSIH